ncbi:MAG TPA: acetyl-CoA carboxylase carboxyltransferase subunit beta [Caulobacteraceae bacterium]|jgi:acetyl-CoA carboxylase carboxyl transferase subunit beta|nr:acetyl-CoA carboxylase carboxyltransferase subunit beta [Caulobacteraceae bacterium]
MALTDDKKKGPIRAPAPPVGRERGGWLAKIAPGVRKLVSRQETPENLWEKCPDTGEMIYRPDLEAAWWVTPSGRHMRIRPNLRFAYTFDSGRCKSLPLPRSPDDPLGFTYGKPYRDSLATARKNTGETDAMAAAVGEIGGQTAVVLVQDFAFMGGSLGAAAGEAFLAAVDEAVKRQVPFVVFTASGGARMQEGTLSLMQLARTTAAIQRLRRAHLPYIVVLTDPTTGGVTASYAMLGDIHLAEPAALIGFAGRRVIEDTIREALPPGFQTAEFQVERGMVDRVVTRKELPAVLGSILRALMAGRASRAAA